MAKQVNAGFMSKISHKEAISQLENCKNNFMLGLFALHMFSSTDELYRFCDSRCKFGNYMLDFDQVVKLLQSEQDIACKEFLKLHLRALIKESFEIVSQYSKQTSFFDTFKEQSWFHIARLIRNAIAHSGHFKIKQSESYQWRNVKLCYQDNGKPLQIDFLGYDGAYTLFEEMYQFLSKIHTA